MSSSVLLSLSALYKAGFHFSMSAALFVEADLLYLQLCHIFLNIQVLDRVASTTLEYLHFHILYFSFGV